MTPGAIIEQLKAQGVTLQRNGESLLAIPKAALTDELRVLIRQHKAELLAELEARPGIGLPTEDPTPSPLSGLDCSTCAHLTMREEWHAGTRKHYFWRCAKGYELLQGRNYGERTILAPPECDAFEQWGAGIR